MSDELFVLRDGTGDCVIDPDGAEVHMAHVRRWTLGDKAFRARYLAQGDRLYAIGNLESPTSTLGAMARRAGIADLLRHWKRSDRAVLGHFDADGDGEIDSEEWQTAVSDAKRIVDRSHREMGARADVHVMRAPRGGLPYILSNRNPDVLAWRFKRWSWLHATMFIVAIAIAGHIMTR